MSKTTRGSITFLLGLAALIFTGCAAKSTPTATAENSSEGYATVNQMGSWIPRKVKKKSDIIGDPTSTTDKELLERANRVGAAGVARDPEQGRH